MDNLFDSSKFPDTEPDELVVGAHMGWTRSDITAAYPPASYSLAYQLNKQDSSGAKVVIPVGEVSSAYVVDAVPGDLTGTLTPGTWEWAAIVTRTSDSAKRQVDQGYFEVLADMTGTPGDTRSHNLIVLQAIKALIEGTATKEQSSYSVAGRSLSRRTPEELINMEQIYARRWEKEKQELDRKAGRGSGGRVLVRMSGN